MPVVIIYHHEHAFNNPSSEIVIGPFRDLEDVQPALRRLCAALNNNRHEENGLWTIQTDNGDCQEGELGDYIGMDDQDLDHGDISMEIWAEVVELHMPDSVAELQDDDEEGDEEDGGE